MAYYNREEVARVLEEYPQYKEKLFCRGFLITDEVELPLTGYPFYNNWEVKKILVPGGNTFSIMTHRQCKSFVFETDNAVHFIVGHAYNPYTMEHRESWILEYLSAGLQAGKEEYWKRESELTGVFCVGYATKDGMFFSTDCTGMQLVFYCNHNNKIFVSSHSKLIADICGYKQDTYITKLINSRFYRYWGTFLPGDRSPYKEVTRVVPNFEYTYEFGTTETKYFRYYPKRKIEEITEDKYEQTINEIARILQNTLTLISLKWPDGKAAISVTGGRDSTTTLASARSVYDKLQYFSYISKETEAVDAEAAQKICQNLGLSHVTYTIPDESGLYDNIEVVKMILECNAGCIGHNNLNDVKKRIYLDTIHDFDVEIKSWVDELSRGEAQNKYQTRWFPAKPTVGYYRCMWKVIVNPWLIAKSNTIFSDYLSKYYNEAVFSYLPWMDYFFWEFSWSAGEGTFLTSEHKYSDEITIPYNNRCLLNTMFTVPLEKRLNSQIQIDVIRLLDRRIEEANAHVKNVAHTNLWSFLIRMYLRVFSIFNFKG